jgi:predicted enzyme related to lactoylglutathione lyase
MKPITAVLLAAAMGHAQLVKEPMSTQPNLPSTVSMIALGVTDVPKSVAFYRDVLALPLQNQSPEFAFFAAGNLTLMLNLALGQSVKPVAGAMELIFPVASVTQARTLVAQRGGIFINEVREVTPGSFASTLKDPDGHHITLFGPK